MDRDVGGAEGGEQGDQLICLPRTLLVVVQNVPCPGQTGQLIMMERDSEGEMEGERWSDRGTQGRDRHRVGKRDREKKGMGERDWDTDTVRKAARKTREGERKDGGKDSGRRGVGWGGGGRGQRPLWGS